MDQEQGNTEQQNNKVFVGNLPYSIDTEGLRKLFAEVEGVEVTDAVVIVDKMNNNRSKGYGFVTLADAEMAQKVIEALNNKEIDGRNMSVSVARPMQPRERRDDRGPRRDRF